MDSVGASGGSFFGQKKGGLCAFFLIGSVFGVFGTGSGAADAQRLACSFHTECIETEACGESGFAMDIDWDGRTWRDVGSDHSDPARPAQVTTEAESFEMLVDLRADVLAFGRVTDAGDWWTLTIYDEVARLSVHMPSSEIALYYLGTCTAEAG